MRSETQRDRNDERVSREDPQKVQDSPPIGSRRVGWRRRCVRLIVIGVITYLGVTLVLTAIQSHLIYFPTRGYHTTPRDVGLEYEHATLTTADGVRIAAWFVPHPSSRATVLFCHGNAGNMADRLLSLNILHRAGFSVLIFDYRGYGDSEGKPNEAGLYGDADTAWRYLVDVKGVPPDRVILFGRSLGGAVAIELATRHRPAALVVESTFTNLVDVGRHHYKWLPVNWMLTQRYESVKRVSRIKCPKLFLHGTDDELIPIELGRRLFDTAAEPKEFIATPGGHNEAGFTYTPEFTRRVVEFVDRALTKRR